MYPLKCLKIITKTLVFVVFSTAVFSAPPVNKVAIPDLIKGAITIDSEMLINLSQKFDNLIVIDSRIGEDRAMGHIEGSLSLSDIDTACDSLKAIIPSKTTPSVFYCNGPKCGRSVIATRKAVACGYRKLFWFRGGFSEWKEKDYPYLNE